MDEDVTGLSTTREYPQKLHCSLSGVLLRQTLAITLALGLIAAAATMWGDLRREKNAVEQLAIDFMSSAAPTAAAAAYNYDQAAAEQVSEGLFLERAIIAVTIINEGEVMVDEKRQVQPTLPHVGGLGSADEIMLTTVLHSPGSGDDKSVIGQLSVVVDKSIVAPEIVDRLLTYFAITIVKNVLFGLLLYWTVFNVLARHISDLSRSTQSWHPGAAKITLPFAPRILQRTEVEALGHRIEQLTDLANGALDLVQRSHDEVLDSNVELTDEVRDRTRELEQANSRLRVIADLDGLTGLYNRACFERLLADASDQTSNGEQELAVMLIDIDHFKAFNDFYGHQAGDDTLITFAAILKQIQTEARCVFARYGGEEFVGMLHSTDITPAQLSEKVHKALEEAAIDHHHSPVCRRLTVSIGTASSSDDGISHDTNTLLSAADDALYEAKNLGRNRTVASTPAIRKQAQQKRLSLHELLEGIEKKEFVPFGQPQVDARTGALVGVEALVRWVRPDGMVHSPARFMKTAERTGLIKKIDAMVLQHLTEFLGAHPRAFPRLSLNVTGDSFSNNDYFDALVQLARHSETKITIELLETAFIDQPDEQFLWQLDTLRDAGVDIEIDDFGTGRTSILGLMAINPCRLKIARELILPLGVRDEQAKLVKSVLEIARSLEMNVIAEGVESYEIANLLIDIGCPVQQGYFHGRPMPLDEFLAPQGSRSMNATQPNI